MKIKERRKTRKIKNILMKRKEKNKKKQEGKEQRQSKRQMARENYNERIRDERSKVRKK